MYKTVHLKKGKEESLKRFHPWIFSGAIHHLDKDISEGEIVRVVTFMGDFIAIGHYQIGSIAVRVLSFQDIHIDETFWESHLGSALAMRRGIGMADNPQNNTYRLVHGEGDNLPGLIIDCYGKTAVMQAHSVGMHNNRFDICKALIKIMGDRIEQVYYKSETTLPYKAELGQENGFIYGSTEEDVAIENGLKFHVDWLKGQKTGFFIDQRENRSLLEHYAKGLYSLECERLSADKKRRNSFHIQLFAGRNEGAIPQCCFHSCCTGWPKGQDTASVASAG